MELDKLTTYFLIEDLMIESLFLSRDILICLLDFVAGATLAA